MREKLENPHGGSNQERRRLLKALAGTAFTVPIMASISRDKLRVGDLDDSVIPVGGKVGGKSPGKQGGKGKGKF